MKVGKISVLCFATLVGWGWKGTQGAKAAEAPSEPRVTVYLTSFDRPEALDDFFALDPCLRLETRGEGVLYPAVAREVGAAVYKFVAAPDSFTQAQVTYGYGLTHPGDRVAVSFSQDGQAYEPVAVHTGRQAGGVERRDLTGFFRNQATAFYLKFHLYAAEEPGDVFLSLVQVEAQPAFILERGGGLRMSSSSALYATAVALREGRIVESSGEPPDVSGGRGREWVGLDGLWKARPETGPDGFLQGYTSPDYDDTGWQPVSLPQGWAAAGFRAEVVWLRRTFPLPPAWQGQRLQLWFDGVDYRAEVWFNGERLGEHEGYFAPFRFEVTDLARFDRPNLVAVRVYSPQGGTPPTVPPRSLIQSLRGTLSALDASGGVWQSVRLLATGDVRIEQVRVIPELSDDLQTGRARVAVTLHNYRSAPLTVGLRVQVQGEGFQSSPLQGGGLYPLPPGGSIVEATVEVPHPQLWWTWDLDGPWRYRVLVRVDDGERVSDAVTTSLGFRRLEVEPESWVWRLNGARLFIRGTNYVPPTGCLGYADGSFARDLDLIRAANLNLVRPYGHVPSAAFLQRCDEVGLLVWADFPLYQAQEDPALRRMAAAQGQELLLLHAHHPCVGLWCPAEDSDAGLAAFLTDQMRNYDPFRFVPPPSGQGDALLSGTEGKATGGSDGEGYWRFAAVQERFVRRFGQPLPPLSEEAGDGLTAELAQATALRYAIEQLRRQRFQPVAGAIHYLFRDTAFAPGWGVVDAEGRLRDSYAALRAANAPVHVFLDYGPDQVRGVWVVNDRREGYPHGRVSYRVTPENGGAAIAGARVLNLPPDSLLEVTSALDWKLTGKNTIDLEMTGPAGEIVDRNQYVLVFPEGREGEGRE